MQQANQIRFIKEVAKYFMDFLESDFHKKNAPKRSISFRNKKNYLVWVNLKKYDKFTKLIREVINNNFSNEIIKSISKWVYYTNIPKDFLDLIALKTKQIKNTEIDLLINRIDLYTKEAVKDHKDDLWQAMEHALRKISWSIDEIFLDSFFSDLEKPIESLKLWDENTIYIMKDELNSVILWEIEEKCKDIVKKLIVWEEVDIEDELKTCLTLEWIKSCILSFFENFKVLDLYEELDELLRNKMIMDKQDFYLYFCDITYNNIKYPLFYIPLIVIKDTQKLYITFDSQIYYNKKAVEYIVQEYNFENKSSTTLKTDYERILYTADDNVFEKINNTLNEIIDFFKLNESIDLKSPLNQIAKSKSVRVSNNCYISIFDKSDESLINDYEEILTKLNNEDDVIAWWFIKLIDDFIYKDPKKVTFKIRDKWSDKTLWEKLVYKSPIPLNEEQQQILQAVQSDECKYIIVQWPPGTGKSHTITAVIFDEILKNNSVLVLSDKKEALDVVEEKITETLNKVRIHDDFQNPILRLWKTWNTFSSILSPSQINKISDAYFWAKSKEEAIEESWKKVSTDLKTYIESEVKTYWAISLKDIHSFYALEEKLENQWYYELLQQLADNHQVYSDLPEIRKLSILLNDLIINFSWDEKTLKILSDLDINLWSIESLDDFSEIIRKCWIVLRKINEIKNKYWENTISKIKELSEINNWNYKTLQQIVFDYDNEKQPIIWFLLKKKALNKIKFSLETEFWYQLSNSSSSDIENLKKILKLLSEWKVLDTILSNDIDEYRFLYDIFTDWEYLNKFENFCNLSNSIKTLKDFCETYPEISESLWITINDFQSLCENELAKIDDIWFNNLLEYISLSYKLKNWFAQVPRFDYNNEKKKIEDIATMQMTQIMDKRFINFYENSKNTALSIKKIIQKKSKFPKEDFAKLKEAFPCIIAWIRDYSEYIPLEPELFDLVIIDEASQVSIAQAFPALLRAKKILVLWDKKQFSNVKTSLASIKQNREYLSRLHENFIENIWNNPSQLIRLDIFNIKSSILDFVEHICNYETMLKKYFRWYKEIISYSNKFFYTNNLQVMKIRWKNIDEVLRFDFIKHDWRIETKQNTNSLEIEHVLEELKKIKESWVKKSVWIITPHTNQQKAFVDAINKAADRDYYINDLKLKIMTFDSCQWEERDIIYYSMVATNEDDRLRWVFAKNLNEIDLDEEEWKLKAQRLNVWFSRAKEEIVFVLSKPISNFNWEIHNTLQHYWNELESAKNEPKENDTDSASPMEKKVLNYILQTDIYQNNKENILFKAQFEIWKYLKQLDATYVHPNYKVDFLFAYTNPTSKKETKIIIEYDWFKEHFKELENINDSNYESYLKEDDIYRQKILEGYWYKFIRLNKFNIGRNPIRTINNKLESLINWTEEKIENDTVINEIKENIEWLSTWALKTCPWCWELRKIEDFKDPSLKSWMWKLCRMCKRWKPRSSWSWRIILEWKEREAYAWVKCPKCWAKMVYRVGRYWWFYWCSRFPRCRGTKQA